MDGWFKDKPKFIDLLQSLKPQIPIVATRIPDSHTEYCGCVVRASRLPVAV